MIKSPTPIIVFGASGRMGQRLCALASASAEHALLGAIVREGSPRAGQTVRELPGGSIQLETPGNSGVFGGHAGVVIIDFSSDQGARASLAMALALEAALLVGTTALSPSTTAMLRDASSKIPLLITPNTSIGVAAVSAALRSLAASLGSAFEVSIVESHHSMKKDAPSGTALRLAQAVRDGGLEVKSDQIVAMRGGDVVGEHTVRFAGAGEYVEVTHRATSRDLFARGALTAARWLSGRAPGCYTMQDVLGINA